MANAILKVLEPLVIHTQVRLRRALLGRLILQAPHAILQDDDHKDVWTLDTGVVAPLLAEQTATHLMVTDTETATQHVPTARLQTLSVNAQQTARSVQTYLVCEALGCHSDLGRVRTSKPAMENSRLGLSRLYTLTNELSQSSVVTDRGSLFFMSQNTARPRFTCMHVNAAHIRQRRNTAEYDYDCRLSDRTRILGCEACSDH